VVRSVTSNYIINCPRSIMTFEQFLSPFSLAAARILHFVPVR